MPEVRSDGLSPERPAAGRARPPVVATGRPIARGRVTRRVTQNGPFLTCRLPKNGRGTNGLKGKRPARTVIFRRTTMCAV